MGSPHHGVLPSAKAFATRIFNAIRLFSGGSFQSENGAYLVLFNSPPVPVIDQDLQHDRYSEAVRRLRSLFPSTCPSLEPGDVTVVGDAPIGAGSFADLWEGVLGDRSILQKSYRYYETCDVESIFQVRNGHSSHTTCSRSIPEISQGGGGVDPALIPPEYRQVCRD